MYSKSERLLITRFLFSKKTDGYISIFSWFSVIGIALGVSAIIVVMSVMNGFRTDLTKRLLGINSHLNIYSNSNFVNFESIEINHSISVVCENSCLIDARGVLERAGHTEAAVDIAKLSSLNPSGVICEILNDDGTMARLPELINFSLSDVPTTISVEVTASDYALSGTHKILLGAYTDDIAISQFIIVTIV